jgi:hypothetical protein
MVFILNIAMIILVQLFIFYVALMLLYYVTRTNT